MKNKIIRFCTAVLFSIGLSALIFAQLPSKNSASVMPASRQDQNAEVFFTADISPAGIDKVWEALDCQLPGNVAVKLSTGEAGNTHYINPNLIKNLVKKINGTIVECNTAYRGSRMDTAMHKRIAEEHGFTAIAAVDIMDEHGSMTLPVHGGLHLKENLVGKNLAVYDSILVLSHFKGHAMGGFGGALKNISIGIASSKGKGIIHGAGNAARMWSAEQKDFIESMAEAAKSVIDYRPHAMLYINIMNHLSVDCDCDGSPAKPELDDIGILASADPVALDAACVDLVYSAKKGNNRPLIERMESRMGAHILDYAESLGAGTRSYILVNLDK